MRKQFLAYQFEHHLFTENESILLAISSGLDSCVMANLFHDANLSFGIAHCNFKLRGKAADEDAVFVKKLAESYNVPFFSIEFETKKDATENGTSIQVAARELRYKWLEETRLANNYQYIATAHHLNDSIETALYNFTKGTGIRGLKGVPLKNGRIIRPLLFAKRGDIEYFAKSEKLDWREDSSNSEDKYARNKLRHHVVPILKELNPNLEKTAARNFKILQETEILYRFAIQYFKDKVLLKNDKSWMISKTNLLQTPAPLSILFEILKEYGFHYNQCKKILKNISPLLKENQTGAIYYSGIHQLLNDREFLILSKKENSGKVKYYINKEKTKLSFNNCFLELIKSKSLPSKFPSGNDIAYFDYEKLSFPLTIRHWQKGDYFCPLGMEGKHQKIQDFFSNKKVSRFEKEQIWLMESDGEICWIIGWRLDERFKITKQTKSVLKVTMQSLSE